MEFELYETIGCDEISVLISGIQEVDLNVLNRHPDVRITMGEKEGYSFRLSNGDRFRSLEIRDDQVFNIFRCQIKKQIAKDHYYHNVFLSFTLNEILGDNLSNVPLSSLQEYLYETIVPYLTSEYGITLDLSVVRICSLEINATVCLEGYYDTYRRALSFITSLVPITNRYSVNNDDSGVDDTESFMKKNLEREFKIYNKSAEMGKSDNSPDDRDIVRIEYRLLKAQKIREVFGTDYLSGITDDQIVDYFMKCIDDDIAKMMKKYHEDIIDKLKNMILNSKKEKPRTWQYDVLESCRNIEQATKRPFLLGIDDFYRAIKDLDHSRHYARIVAAIEKKKVREDVFWNNDNDKIKEILQKLYDIYGDQMGQEWRT